MANDHRALAAARLSHGGNPLSLGDALDLWEQENASEEELAATIQAIRRGLDDMHVGRTVNAFESAERMRVGSAIADQSS